MLPTPWGDAETLRDRRLPPGRGGDRDEVKRAQRERLLAATVACCAEKGYETMAVADLIRVSGVSRATFYELFDDKLDCFRATEREVISAAIDAVAARLGADGEPLDRARAALEEMIGLMVAQPLAARMCMVEAYAAGEAGRDPVRDAVEQIIELASAAIASTDRGPLPADVVRGIVGGFYQVIYERLQKGREAELPDLVPALWDWAMSFPAPPRGLRRGSRIVVSGPVPSAPPFAAYSVEQRIIRGFASAVAARGYSAATIADIAAAASISQTTFYEHFEGKADAFEAALDSSGAQLTAATLPAVRRTADWRSAVRVAFEELCNFFAAEPDFAALRLVEVFAAGPDAIEARDRVVLEFMTTLVTPAERAGIELPQLVLEASSGAILAILFERVRSGHAADLPRLAPVLTYVTLSPFIGAESASAYANGRVRPRP